MGAQESSVAKPPHHNQIKQKEQVKLIKDSRLKLNHIEKLREFIQERNGWQVVYSTEKQGKNWTCFLENVVLSEKSLIVIRDMDDYVFGVYVDQELKVDKSMDRAKRDL